MQCFISPRFILAVSITASALVVSARAERSYEAWRQRFDFEATVSQGATGVAMDRRGDVAVTGFAHDSTDDDKRFYTAKYSGLSGELLWEAFFDAGFGDNIANSVAMDSQGNVIVTGGAADNSGTQENIYTIKYASVDGAVLWMRTFDGPASGADEGRFVAVDMSDNVIVAGVSRGQGDDIQLLRYTAAGTPAGAFTFTGAQTRPDTPAGLVIDSGGFAIVAGTTQNTNGDTDVYLAKVNVGAGAAVFTRIKNGQDSRDDVGKGVAVDPNNNVFINGYVGRADNSHRWYTAKYNASGVLQWEQFFDGPEDDFLGPAGVAADAAGNAFVTGTSTVDNFKTTIYTAKYRSADGAMLWEKRSPAPDGDDAAVAVASDGAGNVVVTGTSDHKNRHDADYYTVKYAGADGDVLWEQRFDGSFRGGGPDAPAGVAVDMLGNVAISGVSTRNHPNQATGLTGFVTLKYQRLLGLTGDAVPGAGIQGTRVPRNAKFKAIGSPAIADNGAVAARASFGVGSVLLKGVLFDGGGSSSMVAVQGGAAPDVTGGKFKSFADPVLAPNGTIAFAATLGGVPLAQSSAVFTNAFGGVMHRALQTGIDAPGLGAGTMLKKIVSMSLRNGELVALLKLKGTGVTDANDLALIRIQAGGPLQLLRTGQILTVGGQPASAITKISVLNPASGSAGHGRSQADGRIVAKVMLADGRVVVVTVTSAGVITPLLFTGQSASTVAANGQWESFGTPAVGSSGANFVSLGVLSLDAANGISKSNDHALVFSSNGATFDDFAREGQAAAILSGLNYAGFSDPVVNANGNVAFVATLKGQGVTSNNREGLWQGPPGALGFVARLGDPAPDGKAIPRSAKYGAFGSIALPGGTEAGVVFTATLRGPDVTTKNDAALFAEDSDALIRRLLRKGDLLGTRKVAGFKVLKSLPTVYGATRTFNTRGAVAVLVTFTNGTKAIVTIGIP